MRWARTLLLIAVCALAQTVFFALADESAVSYEFSMQMLEDEQSFLIRQRVTLENRADETLLGALFSVPANVFRRESALPYDNETLEKAFPSGYAPGGIEFTGVWANGEPADWGMKGENETFLRVACQIPPGETGEFVFDYALLLTDNRAFLGCGDADWRLTDFYPSLCVFEYGDYAANEPTRAGEWRYAECADFTARIVLPEDYEIASGGECLETLENGARIVDLTVARARSLSFAVSRRFHIYSGISSAGTEVRVCGQNRARLKNALNAVLSALNLYEDWFGAYPYRRLSVVESQIAKTESGTGVIFLNRDEWKDESELRFRLLELAARQYFQEVVHADPAREAWLFEGLSRYAALWAVCELDGEAAFSRALNERLLPSLQVTIPGGLYVNAATGYFPTQRDYEIVTRERGAAVLNELAFAMGRENMKNALSEYVRENRFSIASISEFAAAMNRATGREWDQALAAWIYTIDDYSQEILESYD